MAKYKAMTFTASAEDRSLIERLRTALAKKEGEKPTRAALVRRAMRLLAAQEGVK